MDIQKKQISLNIPVAELTTSVVVASDAIVNDSKPDLLKIIQISPSIRIHHIEASDGKLRADGHITYKVLYQPENADGICSIFTGTDFSHTEENPLFSEGMYTEITADTEHVESELINSRKIKIKSVVGLNINVTKCDNIMIPTEVHGDNLCACHSLLSGLSRIITKRDVITVSDSLPLTAGKPNIDTLLRSDVTLCNKDIKVIAGKVIIKGELRLSTLYLPENSGFPECCSHSLPFTEILDAEGIKEDHLCRVITEIDEYDVSPVSDSDGDMRNLNTNIRIGVRILADDRISENVLTDVYSLTENLDLSYTEIDAKIPVDTFDFDYTINCSLYPDASDSAKSVCNVTTKPVITHLATSDGSVSMEGYLDISCLFITTDSTSPVRAHSQQVPFKTDLPVDNCRSGMEISSSAETNLLNFQSGLTGETDVRAVISCHIQLSEPHKIRIIDSVNTAGVVEKKMPSIVLYFVQTGDTLWDIAKRYHTKEEYIRELNGDACDNLNAGCKLLIPRG